MVKSWPGKPKKKIQLVIGASSRFISDYMLYHCQQQVLLTRVGNTMPFLKTICTKNIYKIRVNSTWMDQSECFGFLGFLLGRVYPTGVNFTTISSQNRELMWAATAQNNYILSIAASLNQNLQFRGEIRCKTDQLTNRMVHFWICWDSKSDMALLAQSCLF